MLEKAPANIDVKKLRAILLLEADFNAVHKIIFNRKIMLRLKDVNIIPNEIINGRRIQAVTHLALSKKLISDIVNM